MERAATPLICPDKALTKMCSQQVMKNWCYDGLAFSLLSSSFAFPSHQREGPCYLTGCCEVVRLKSTFYTKSHFAYITAHDPSHDSE